MLSHRVFRLGGSPYVPSPASATAGDDLTDRIPEHEAYQPGTRLRVIVKKGNRLLHCADLNKGDIVTMDRMESYGGSPTLYTREGWYMRPAAVVPIPSCWLPEPGDFIRCTSHSHSRIAIGRTVVFDHACGSGDGSWWVRMHPDDDESDSLNVVNPLGCFVSD